MQKSRYLYTLALVALLFTLAGCEHDHGTGPEPGIQPVFFSQNFKQVLSAGISVGEHNFVGEDFLTNTSLVDIVSSDSAIVVAAGSVATHPTPGPASALLTAKKVGEAWLYLYRFTEEGKLDSARVRVE